LIRSTIFDEFIMVLFSASGTLGETKNRPPIRAAVFNPPAEIYLVSFLTTHRRELSFPIKDTFALPLLGCQTRLRVVPDVARDRLITAAKGNNNLCHSENNRRNVNWMTQNRTPKRSAATGRQLFFTTWYWVERQKKKNIATCVQDFAIRI